MQRLDVYFCANKVGELHADDSLQLSFQYTTDYLANPSAIPISLSLPLQVQAFQHAPTRAYFANLLPEGSLRTRLSRILGIADTNDFGLLTALGGDTAGAVSLHEPTKQVIDRSYHSFDQQQLGLLPATLTKQPFMVGHPNVRLGLSGAQNKLPLFIDQNQFHLPLGLSTSNYVIKTALTEFPNSIENEWFCMKLARAVGLPVPMVNMLRHPSLYIVKRYDRKQTATGYAKLHQEDFCQALGLVPEQKYAITNGPTLARCFALLRQYSSAPARDIHYLLQWVIFNFLIGNSDGHAKNIALLLTESGVQLAPFYDLISTAVYPELTNKLALTIADENNPEKINQTHWREFAKEIGIKTNLLEKTLTDLTHKIHSQAQLLLQHLPDNMTISDIIHVIQKRSKHIIGSF